MPKSSYHITPKQIKNVLKTWNLKCINKKGDIEIYSGIIKNKKVKVSVDNSVNYTDSGISSISSQANISKKQFYKSTSSTRPLRIIHTSGRDHKKKKIKKKGFQEGKGSRKYYK